MSTPEELVRRLRTAQCGQDYEAAALIEAQAKEIVELKLAENDAATSADECANRLAALRRERDELRADKDRMDYLESEWPREEAWRADPLARSGCCPPSLFRTNMPITREVIDAARQRWSKPHPSGEEEGK